MAGSSFGTFFKITTFGESHGAALGVVVDGCPSGIPLNEATIQKELDRRRPGHHDGQFNASVTARKEADACQILSGVFEGRTTGTPIAIVIPNTSQHSKDYDALKDTFRPGHADYTYTQKYGIRDHRGGGRSSGRETAARVAAGAVAKAYLTSCTDITVTAFTMRAAGISCQTIDLSLIEKNPLRAADLAAAEAMAQRIDQLRRQGDSAGGLIQCQVTGVPAGLGEPVFDKLDAELAKAMVSIGAVKGVEFGVGFGCIDMTGSTMNDDMYLHHGDDGTTQPAFRTNNAGGILGGISSGNTILFNVAVKPVPSIFLEQQTVAKVEGQWQDTILAIHGRHDVCLCPRIVPVVEAMTWLTLADLHLRQGKRC
ncbi:MAG: chorismate synthase [Spirochaetaceae bacterium]|nr:chorismate synthase [Spirochaetaceae bacterium]MBQ8561599.1 chorismate synthase [Spirochaetaceae bacterium]